MSDVKCISYALLFFIKKNRLLKNGEATICMRITVEGKRCETNLKMSILPSLWNQAKEHSRGKDRKSQEINA